MMVRSVIGSKIDIWPEELITNKYVRDAHYRDIKIIQIEHAYADKFIVEFIPIKEPKIETDYTKINKEE